MAGKKGSGTAKVTIIQYIVALALLMPSVALTQPSACGNPAPIDDGWEIVEPKAAGLDEAKLCGIAERLRGSDADVHAVVVIRHGKLVFEQYFSGYDDP